MSIGKNGNLTFSDNLLEKMETKYLSDGSEWARIYYLDVSSTKEFFSSNETLNCTDRANRFSRMGIVDNFMSSDGYYEFMLTYPSLSTTLYNRWKQTSSANEGTVSGLVKITTTWSSHNFGIRKHGSSCVYDCDTGGSWFAPICQTASWTDTQYIPAADGSSQTQCELWVRYDNVPTMQNGICECEALDLLENPSDRTFSASGTSGDIIVTTDLYTAVIPNATYYLEAKCDSGWADGHGYTESRKGKGTIWLYLHNSYDANNYGFNYPVNFNSASSNKVADGIWKYTIPSGYVAARVRINTYSNDTDSVTATFRGIHLIPEKYYISDKIKARFADDYVSCDEIIEL